MASAAVSHVQLVPAAARHYDTLLGLLAAAQLPSGDIRGEQLGDFQIVEENGDAIGAIGLERYGDAGLVRSLVVLPAFRGYGLGTMLLEAETRARGLGLTALYLLTTTARAFFEQRGYRVIARERVPRALQASSEFAHLCPASATCLYKPLA